MSREIIFATGVVKEAQSLTVSNHEQAEYATEVLSRANKALDVLTTKEDERTRRLKEELEFIKAPYSLPKKQLKAIIADLREKLGKYQTAHMQVAEKKAEVIASKAENEIISPVVAMRQLDKIGVPAPKLAGATGTLTFRPKQTVKIVNRSLIPRKYLVADFDLILADLVADKYVPGCEIEIIQVPFNRRN